MFNSMVALPSDEADVMATADGNLVMAYSAVNRVAPVEVGND